MRAPSTPSRWAFAGFELRRLSSVMMTKISYARYLCLPQIPSSWRAATNWAMLSRMAELLQLIWSVLTGLFRSRASREAEIAALRHQLNVLHRQSPKRPTFSALDRLIFVSLFHIAPRITDAMKIVEPETVIRWHRSGFRLFWRWKSRSRRGRRKSPWTFVN